MEIVAGSDPLNRNEAEELIISSTRVDSLGRLTVTWPVYWNANSVDIAYRLEYSIDLINWIEIGSVVSDGDTTTFVELTDTGATTGIGFYRLRAKIK